MRVTFRNLGPIEKTKLDVRPMTVIIGPNNAGKTYLAYAVYGLWKDLADSFTDNADLHLHRRASEISADVEQFVEWLKSSLREDIRYFQRHLAGYFQDTSETLFATTQLDVQVTKSDVEDAIAQHHDVPTEYCKCASIRGSSVVVETKATSKDVLLDRQDRMVAIFSHHLKRILFPRPFLLPAERNAFVITYKLLANRRFKLLRDQQRELFGTGASQHRKTRYRQEQGDLRYPTPIEDFLDFLTDVELEKRERASAAQQPFHHLAADIEANLQNQHKTRLVSTALGGREVKVEVRDDLTIDLYNASSSIKQLAPLLLYLRHRAEPNQMVIIDEPEMNLHPEAQAKLLEVLGILVNLGVHVLLTTHSPYFMAHLNNLVAGDTARPAVLKRQAQSLYLGDPRAFLRMDQVGAYEMKDNQLRSLKDEAYGIRWDTLSDVSVDIQQRFFAIQQAKQVKQARRGKAK